MSMRSTQDKFTFKDAPICNFSITFKLGEEKDQEYNQVPNLNHAIIWESDKMQENITHKRAKRSANS